MKFNRHLDLEGRHAFLSASNYHWTNYDDNKLRDRYMSALAVKKGSDLHDLAKHLIELGVSLPKNKKTLNLYVNDAIAFRMTPEQPLYYSENCFGTADAICFRNNTLRIHDLKTGQTVANIIQLRIYAALFCLEYGFKPGEIEIVLRLYQSGEVTEEKPEPHDIYELMRKIVDFDAILSKYNEEFNQNA